MGFSVSVQLFPRQTVTSVMPLVPYGGHL